MTAYMKRSGESDLGVDDRGLETLVEEFEAAKGNLLRLAELRLGILRQRLDASDIVQETYLEVNRRSLEFQRITVPPVIWFRKLARQVIARQYRNHFGVKMRDGGREAGFGQADSESMAFDLSASMASPESVAALDEERQELQRLLSQMSSLEREVLCLRQVEGLTFSELSAELEISESKAKRAFHRAIVQLRQMRSFLNKQSVP